MNRIIQPERRLKLPEPEFVESRVGPETIDRASGQRLEEEPDDDRDDEKGDYTLDRSVQNVFPEGCQRPSPPTDMTIRGTI